MRLLFLAVLTASAASAQAPDTLRAALDLRGPIAVGWLAPAAEAVGLRGDLAPLSWGATTTATDPDGDGIYHAAIPFVLPADTVTVSLKIKVDGAAAPNDGWQEGRNHTVRMVRGEGGDLALAWGDVPAPPPSTVTGRVDRIPDVAGAGLAPRDVFVYLPPGYADTDRRYPVLYLHDGQNVFDAAAAGAEWGMDEAAQTLIAAGEIEPMIVVGVANTPSRTDEYTPTPRRWRHVLERTAPPTADGPLGPLTGTFAVDDDVLVIAADDDGLTADIPGEGGVQRLEAQPGGRFFHPQAGITFGFQDADGRVDRVIATKPPEGGLADRYGELLVETVKPLVDRLYRTRPDAAHTGLGGSSLGGLVSMHLGLRHPDVFGRLLVASPSVWWDDRWILGAVASAPAPGAQRIWLDMGTAEGDGMVAGARALRDALSAAGWTDIRYVEAEGAAHTERAWAERAPDMLRFLFPPE